MAATITPTATNLAGTTTQDIQVVPAEQSARLNHDGVWSAAAVVWRPHKVMRGSQEGDFAEYVTGAATSKRQVRAAVPNVLSVATSFTIYREQPL